MECLCCNNKEFKIKSKTFKTESSNGMVIKAKAPAYICTKCGESLMNTEQMDFLRKSFNKIIKGEK